MILGTPGDLDVAMESDRMPKELVEMWAKKRLSD
jgi:hypothetical protein